MRKSHALVSLPANLRQEQTRCRQAARADGIEQVDVRLRSPRSLHDAMRWEDSLAPGDTWPIWQEGAADVESFDTMILCLRTRAERGMRLVQLTLRVYVYYSENRDHEDFKAAYLPCLQELVDDISYEMSG